MIQKVAFTLYPVQDATRARAFYEQTLGLTRGKSSESGVWTEYDLPGGGCLALYQTTDLKPSADSGGSIALEVADLNAFVGTLKTAGVTFKAENIQSPVCLMAIALDSEGNAIILHQLHKK